MNNESGISLGTQATFVAIIKPSIGTVILNTVG